MVIRALGDKLLRLFKKGAVLEKAFAFDKKVTNKEIMVIRNECDTQGLGFYADTDKVIVLADAQKRMKLVLIFQGHRAGYHYPMKTPK